MVFSDGVNTPTLPYLGHLSESSLTHFPAVVCSFLSEVTVP